MIVSFPGHQRQRCPGTTDACYSGACAFCGGGLYYCRRCCGAEGSLPTDCPGEPMPEVVSDAVYDGWLDYDRRRGWVCEPATQWRTGR